MAVTLTYSDEELSTTAAAYLKNERAMQDINHPFLDDMIAAKKTVEGGERLIIPWDVQRHSQTTQLSTGYEPVSLVANPVSTPGNQGWFYAIRPIIISNRDTIINRGASKQMDLLQSRVQDTERGLRAEWEDASLRGGVPTFSDHQTLNGFDDQTGFLEESAVGAQNNTVHAVSKATFATLPGFQNQNFDFAGAFGANGLTGLSDMIARIKDVTTERTQLRGYASIQGELNLKRVVQTQERYTTELDAGKQVLVYDGIPIKVTSRLPNSGTVTTADPWTFLFVDWSAVRFIGQTGWVMNMDQFREISGHVTRAAFMHLFGQFTVEHFGSHAVGFDGEVF